MNFQAPPRYQCLNHPHIAQTTRRKAIKLGCSQDALQKSINSAQKTHPLHFPLHSPRAILYEIHWRRSARYKIIGKKLAAAREAHPLNLHSFVLESIH